MKDSIRKLADFCLNALEDELIVIDAAYGISTSGLRLFLGLVDWIISRLLGEVCESTLKPYCRPFALYWASHNALKSHEARPWKKKWIDPRSPF